MSLPVIIPSVSLDILEQQHSDILNMLACHISEQFPRVLSYRFSAEKGDIGIDFLGIIEQR